MACVHCGRDLPPAASRCPWCGEPVTPPAVPAAFLAMLRECRVTPLTIRLLVRKNLKMYMALCLLFVALGGLAILMDMPTLAVGVAGAWLGVVTRDFAWFRAVVKNWPSQAAVMDWQLIDRLAAGEPAEKTTL